MAKETNMDANACLGMLREKRTKVLTDSLRPHYHFAPPAQWMNDPNAAIEIGEWYHIFYLHDPYSSDGLSSAVLPDGNIVTGDKKPNRVWGHTKTKDFINWVYCPPALTPDREKGEIKPMSGDSILLPDGTPMIMYTSASNDACLCQRVAIGNKDASYFKQRIDPVITQFMESAPKMNKEFRDPFVFIHNERYHALLGAQIDKEGELHSVVSLYTADDAPTGTWHFTGILLSRPSGEIPYFECPKLFQIKDKWVLIFSPYGPPRYFVGEINWEYCAFLVESQGYIDYTSCAYATTSLQTSDNIVRLFSWIPGWVSEDQMLEHWNGCLSIPHVLTLTEDLVLLQRPDNSILSLMNPRSTVGDGFLPTERSWVISMDKMDTNGKVFLAETKYANPLWSMEWDSESLCVNEVKITASVTDFKLFWDGIVWELFVSDGRYCFSGITKLTSETRVFFECDFVHMNYNTISSISCDFED